MKERDCQEVLETFPLHRIFHILLYCTEEEVLRYYEKVLERCMNEGCDEVYTRNVIRTIVYMHFQAQNYAQFDRIKGLIDLYREMGGTEENALDLYITLYAYTFRSKEYMEVFRKIHEKRLYGYIYNIYNGKHPYFLKYKPVTFSLPYPPLAALEQLMYGINLFLSEDRIDRILNNFKHLIESLHAEGKEVIVHYEDYLIPVEILGAMALNAGAFAMSHRLARKRNDTVLSMPESALKSFLLKLSAVVDEKDLPVTLRFKYELERKNGNLLTYYNTLFEYVAVSGDFKLIENVPEEHLTFMRTFFFRPYTKYLMLKAEVGEMSLNEVWEMAYKRGTLGYYDNVWVLLRAVSKKSRRAFINFSEKLSVAYGEDEPLPLRDTYLRSKSALAGLSYLLVFHPDSFIPNHGGGFRFKRGALRRFLSEYSESLYPNLFRKYRSSLAKLKERLNRRIEEDINRVGQVISTGRLRKDVPINLRAYEVEGPYGKRMYISGGHNFEAAARYRTVFTEFVDEPEEWMRPFKRKAWEIYRDFVNDYADNVLTRGEFNRLIDEKGTDFEFIEGE